MKSKCPSWQGKATVRLRRQGRRGVAFTGAKRKPLTEEAGDQAQNAGRKEGQET
jgi:hypothetical protein